MYKIYNIGEEEINFYKNIPQSSLIFVSYLLFVFLFFSKPSYIYRQVVLTLDETPEHALLILTQYIPLAPVIFCACARARAPKNGRAALDH